MSRHKAPYPPAPGDTINPTEIQSNVPIGNVDRTSLDHSDCNEDGSPLLTGSEEIETQPPNLGMLSSPHVITFWEN